MGVADNETTVYAGKKERKKESPCLPVAVRGASATSESRTTASRRVVAPSFVTVEGSKMGSLKRVGFLFQWSGNDR